jgi:hypothetical protein
VVKQYLRENFFVGELEVEMTAPIKSKLNYNRTNSNQNDLVPSDSGNGSQMTNMPTPSNIGHLGYTIIALQDNQGKNIKRKSVMVHNFYKTTKEENEAGAPQHVQSAVSNTSRKLSRENMILKMFKKMREKS